MVLLSSPGTADSAGKHWTKEKSQAQFFTRQEWAKMCIFGPNACSWQIPQSRGCVCCTAQNISHVQPLFRGWCQVGKENTLGSVSMRVCSGGEDMRPCSWPDSADGARVPALGPFCPSLLHFGEGSWHSAPIVWSQRTVCGGTGLGLLLAAS